MTRFFTGKVGQTLTEDQLTAALNVILSDTTLGPLSDTVYEDTSVNADQQLELWEHVGDVWPSGTIDTPQLARELMNVLQRGTFDK